MSAFSQFASSVGVESAFSVLAIAKRLMAAGKDVIELEIGDSPFSTPPRAIEAGVQAIRDGHSRYGPSLGIMEFRTAAAEYVQPRVRPVGHRRPCRRGPGAKNFEQLFCEAFLNAWRWRAGVQPALPDLSAEHLPAQRAGRPLGAEGVERLPAEPRRRAPVPCDDKSPRAIFLNSPHNPTGGVATFEDLEGTRRRSCAARTSRSSATSRTTGWSGAAGITRCSSCRACSSRRSRPTRSASRSA